MPGPLSDYRVLELTSTVSGPMAGMMLADQGADVIKIEPPRFGDTARYLGSIREGMGAMFAVLRRAPSQSRHESARGSCGGNADGSDSGRPLGGEAGYGRGHVSSRRSRARRP